MRTLILLLLLVITTISCKDTAKKDTASISEDTTTYYLIRHAEKDRSNPEDVDPMLNEAGVERAKKWASYFDEIPLTQVFSTAYNRTQQTAAYVASNKNLDIELYEVGSLYNDEFKELTKGQHVLIVGHSNTTPQLVNKIIGQDTYNDIADDDNASLYVVTISGGNARVQVKRVN